jgi:hypothetical protein
VSQDPFGFCSTAPSSHSLFFLHTCSIIGFRSRLSITTTFQVLLFVQNYVRRHRLDDATIRLLYRGVRLPYLSNERLSAMFLRDGGAAPSAGGADSDSSGRGTGSAGSVVSSSSGVGAVGPPKDMLLAAMAHRLHLLDHPERLPPATGGTAALPSDSSDGGGSTSGSGSGGCGGLPAPRKTYCCSVEYGLPGGSEYVSVPMEAVWEDLAANLTVRVSGGGWDDRAVTGKP